MVNCVLLYLTSLAKSLMDRPPVFKIKNTERTDVNIIQSREIQREEAIGEDMREEFNGSIRKGMMNTNTQRPYRENGDVWYKGIDICMSAVYIYIYIYIVIIMYIRLQVCIFVCTCVPNIYVSGIGRAFLFFQSPISLILLEWFKMSNRRCIVESIPNV